MHSMAEALWNSGLDFNRTADAFYRDMFGECADELAHYFKTLSRLSQTPWMRGERPVVDEGAASQFAQIALTANEALPRILTRLGEAADPFMKKTWNALAIHAHICAYVSAALAERAKGEYGRAKEKWRVAADYVNRMEPLIHDMFDAGYYIDVVGRIFEKERNGC
jgi:hypothetical protein